jgi:hypothetical protein
LPAIEGNIIMFLILLQCVIDESSYVSLAVDDINQLRKFSGGIPLSLSLSLSLSVFMMVFPLGIYGGRRKMVLSVQILLLLLT